MDISTAKVVLALAETWGVPAKHGNIPNAYVRSTPWHLLACVKRYYRVGEHSAQYRCYASRRSLLGAAEKPVRSEASRAPLGQLFHAQLSDA